MDVCTILFFVAEFFALLYIISTGRPTTNPAEKHARTYCPTAAFSQ